MKVLELFTPSRRELRVGQVAELLGRPKSTISRWMSEMAEAGFLDRDEDSARYRLGMRLAGLAELARQSTSLQRMARPALERITAATGETSDLVLLLGRDAVNVEAVESRRPIKHVGWVGRKLPLHATAAGKALLAWRSHHEVARLLRFPLKRYTEATIVQRDRLGEELALVRTQGYSTAWGELDREIAGVAAPVRDFTGSVVGVLTIGAPTARTPEQALPNLARILLNEAARLSMVLGHSSYIE